jgi:hypothetical protein
LLLLHAAAAGNGLPFTADLMSSTYWLFRRTYQVYRPYTETYITSVEKKADVQLLLANVIITKQHIT